MNFKTILILVLFFPGAGHAQDVVINEFLASNITIYPEMNDFDDNYLNEYQNHLQLSCPILSYVRYQR